MYSRGFKIITSSFYSHFRFSLPRSSNNSLIIRNHEPIFIFPQTEQWNITPLSHASALFLQRPTDPRSDALFSFCSPYFSHRSPLAVSNGVRWTPRGVHKSLAVLKIIFFVRTYLYIHGEVALLEAMISFWLH